ncbi:hypothetical protein SBADM41S_04980 [Streptomyces badius]
MTPRRPCCSSSVTSSTPSGEKPARTSSTSEAVSTTTSTLWRPSSVQYTSSRCRIRANSSSTRPAPTPKITAKIPAATPCRPLATAPNPPTTERTTPGTTWWMCIPPWVTLRKGPFPARIMRVTVRVIAKVRTKAASARSSGSLPGSAMLSCHQ